MEDQEGRRSVEADSVSDSSLSQLLAAVDENVEPGAPIAQVTDIRVHISQDGTEAFLSLSAVPEEPYPFTVDNVTQAIKERGVVEGILFDQIEETVNEQLYVSDFLIAKGRKPEDGEDARIEFLFDPTPKPYSDDDVDRVDWRELNLIQRVAENQPVARKTPARQGTPGVTVTGRPIEPRKARDIRLPMGKGTKIDESDTNLLLAAIAGSVRLASNQVVVDRVLTVPHDVDFSVGNIDIDGGVHVGGNVMPGFRVRATGDVHVEGYVESAVVESGGSIWISQGILGQDNKTAVRAEVDVHAKFATNAAINAGGDINIQWDAVNCHLESGGTVSVGAPEVVRGRIVGGNVIAATAIRAVHVGAESGTSTILNITLKTISNINREMREAAERIEKLQEQHERVMAEVARLLPRRILGDGTWNENSAQLLARLTATAKQIEDDVLSLEARLLECKAELTRIGEPRIAVRGTIFPGVKTTIGHVNRSFNEKLQGVLLVLTDDQSRIVTLSN